MNKTRLLRYEKFNINSNVVSQFQLNINDRDKVINVVFSVEGNELKFHHTKLSGYITIEKDIDAIYVLFDANIL